MMSLIYFSDFSNLLINDKIAKNKYVAVYQSCSAVIKSSESKIGANLGTALRVVK